MTGGPPPPVFFVKADSKGLMGTFCVKADSKGLAADGDNEAPIRSGIRSALAVTEQPQTIVPLGIECAANKNASCRRRSRNSL